MSIMTKKQKKYYDIIWETLDLMYRASTPSITFDELIHKCGYEDMNGNSVDVDHYLTDAEIHELKYRRAIPFMDYEIEKSVAVKILNDQIKKYKLNKVEREGFEMNIWLGCSPKFKSEKNEK